MILSTKGTGENKMDAMITVTVMSDINIFTEYKMKCLEDKIKANGSKIISIEEGEAQLFGETLKCKKIVLERNEIFRIEGASSEEQGLLAFNMKYNAMMLGGSITNLSVEIVKSLETEEFEPEIVDADWCLFELDANNVDEITIAEAFGQRTTITRAQVIRHIENIGK